jgi:hypothetical protein
MGLGKSIAQGVVSTSYGAALQFDAPISSGSSGGPVLDGHGRVVGIATMSSKASRGTIVQNLNFAISVAAFPSLESFQLPSSRAAVTTPNSTPLSSLDLPPSVQGPSIAPTEEPTVKRAEPVTPGSSPGRGSIPNPTPDHKFSKWPDGRMLIHPEHSMRAYVINVARDDTLTLRSGPGTRFPPVKKIPPDGTGIIVFQAAEGSLGKPMTDPDHQVVRPTAVTRIEGVASLSGVLVIASDQIAQPAGSAPVVGRP